MIWRNFLAELKRRNVYKVAVAYAVVGWLLIQVATQVFPFFEIPNRAVRVVVLAIVLGFPIALVIAWAYELTPEGIKRTSEADILPNTRPAGRGWIFVALVAGTLSLGLFFLGRYSASSLRPGASAGAKSIAVLPFENRSEDAANAYLADGIQDEILTRLAKIDGLKVISRTSTRHYKNSPDSLGEIAKQLGVTNVLEGSVQRVGDEVRVNVQLINAETDAHLWAEVYDRKLSSVLAMQSEIAGTIAKALRLKLSSREEQAVALRSTDNPEAYDAYLRGLALWNAPSLSPESLQKMTAAYSRAVQLDPGFAVAWAGLSQVQTFSYATYDPTAARLAEAKHAVDTAMQLQPDLGDAWFALGLYRYRASNDYEGALAAFQQATERGANRAQSLEYSGNVKRRQGRWDEAVALHRQSAELDPRNPVIFSELADTYRCLRRFAEAQAALDRALAISPDSQNLVAEKALDYQAAGRLDAAAPLLERLAIDAADPELLQPRFNHLMYAGRFPDAVVLLEQLLATTEPLPEYLRAVYRTHLGLARRLAGDADGATHDLKQGRDELEALRRQSVGEGYAEDLMMAEAFLGNRAAVDRYAVMLQDTITKDAYAGPSIELAIALSRAQLGQSDEAIALIGDLLRKPGEESITTAQLRNDPVWIPLRNDPRFQKLVAAD